MGVSMLSASDNACRSNIVWVIDDEESVLRAVDRLLRASGYSVRIFRAAENCLPVLEQNPPGCIVVDLAMPECNGLELQEKLARCGSRVPLVFISGHGDVASSVKALRGGAVDFLVKPVEDRHLIAAVDEALDKEHKERELCAERRMFNGRYSLLTPREREVLAQLLAGKLNKEIAAYLGMVERTVKVHRARVLRKMGTRSLAVLAGLRQRVTR